MEVRIRGLVCREKGSALQVGPVDMSAAAGEVVGLVGLRGAGQELVARGIRDKAFRVSGTVDISAGPGVTDVPPRVQAPRANSDVAVVPADRKADGIFEKLTLTENLFPRDLTWKRRGGVSSAWVSHRGERAAAEELLQRFRVRPGVPSHNIETLSGGNQQKVVLARAVSSGSAVLMLEEPTAGVDIGARAEIYRLVRAAADEGRVVLVVSTDFEEVAGLCDRVYVYRGARLVDELVGCETSKEQLARIAVGAEVDD